MSLSAAEATRASAAIDVADRNSRNASLTLAFAQPGDTLLYLLLPLHHSEFGVNLTEAGLLLAANRLVRIAGYGRVARLFAERGPYAACLLAALGSLLSTLGYATLSGVWPLLIARLMWGLSFAVMNIATQALATSEPTGAARRNGRMRSIIAAGPVSPDRGLPGFASDRPAGSVFCAVRSGLACPRVRRPATPVRRRPTGAAAAAALRVPSRLDTWSFIQGMTLDGLFVLGISIFAAAAMPEYAGLAAGGALALRYVAEIMLGPSGGALAERYGPRRVLTLLSVSTAVGLAMIGAGVLWIGAILVVVVRGLIQPISPPLVAIENPGRDRVPALARLATWRDLGAGAGPLLAGALLPIVAHELLYGAAAMLLATSAVAVAMGGIHKPKE